MPSWCLCENLISSRKHSGSQGWAPLSLLLCHWNAFPVEQGWFIIYIPAVLWLYHKTLYRRRIVFYYRWQREKKPGQMDRNEGLAKNKGQPCSRTQNKQQPFTFCKGSRMLGSLSCEGLFTVLKVQDSTVTSLFLLWFPSFAGSCGGSVWARGISVTGRGLCCFHQLIGASKSGDCSTFVPQDHICSSFLLVLLLHPSKPLFSFLLATSAP